MDTVIIACVAAIALIIVISALLNNIPRKIGLRNVWRRKSNTALVVIGSMIATALITSSLVLQDSMDKTFYNQVLENEGEIDANISFEPKTETATPFTAVAGADLDALMQRLTGDRVDGAMPVFRIMTSPFSINEAGEPQLQSYNILLTALRPEDAAAFGSDPVSMDFGDSNTNVILSTQLADELEAQVGTRISFTYYEQSFQLTVHSIMEPNGIVGNRGYVVNRSLLTGAFGLPENSGQYILVSHAGGVRPEEYDGPAFTTVLDGLLASASPEGITSIVTETKEQALDGYGMGNFVLLLLAISIFGSCVGTLLIISLYSMLAAERKSEMGIMRAIGFTRGGLVKTFVYEGFVYSLLASLTGTVVGIGLGSWLVNSFVGMFGGLFDALQQGPMLDFEFDYTLRSLAIGASSGFIFTIITVIISSYAFSKINIVNAIRRLPDITVYRWKLGTVVSLAWKCLLLVIGAASVVLSTMLPDMLTTMRGQAGSAVANMTESSYKMTTDVACGYLQYFGVLVLIWIAALALIQFVKIAKQRDISRWTFRAASVLSIVFNAFIQRFPAIDKAIEHDTGAVLFFFSGGMLVISAAVLIAFSLDAIVKLIDLFFRRFGKLNLVFRMGLRYPDANASRTGMTLIMFSLIIYLVVFISSIKTSINTATDEMRTNALGGYSIDIVFSQNAEQAELSDSIQILQSSAGVQSAAGVIEMPVVLPNSAPLKSASAAAAAMHEIPEHAFGTRLVAAPAEFMKSMEPVFEAIHPDYADPDAVWAALEQDSSKIVLGGGFDRREGEELADGTKLQVFVPGDTITIADQANAVAAEKTIIATIKYEGEGFGGINNEYTSQLIGGPNSVADTFGAELVNTYAYRELLVIEKEGIMKADLVKQIKKDLLGKNISYIMDIDLMLGAAFELINSILLLLQGFLSLNLLIGSAGLAIIIARAVHERRQQIGMLRSLGFKRSMVLGVFFIESTFVALLSIAIGVSMGLVSVNTFFKIMMEGEGMKLVYPFQEIGIIVGGVYLLAILLSMWPAFKASRLSPVEATNYPE
ncbi:MAG: FtsX-like permease family protein [Patescibacteria group bacterium]